MARELAAVLTFFLLASALRELGTDCRFETIPSQAFALSVGNRRSDATLRGAAYDSTIGPHICAQCRLDASPNPNGSDSSANVMWGEL